MSLLSKAEEASGNEGKGEAQTLETVVETTASAGAETKPSAAEVAARALANHQSKASAVAVAAPKINTKVLAELRNALPVEFNSLAQVQAVQGSFRDKETETKMGETIRLRLLSWQDSWVVGPNDTKAPKDTVKYSDDGVTAKDGTLLQDHLKELKEKYPKAKISQRVVVVGALLETEKPHKLNGELVQIDLSPQSRAMFLRYQANVAWRLATNALTEEDVLTVELSAVQAKGPDKEDYTKVEFQAAKLADEAKAKAK